MNAAPAAHIATTAARQGRADEAASLCRQLLPHLRDRVLYSDVNPKPKAPPKRRRKR